MNAFVLDLVCVRIAAFVSKCLMTNFSFENARDLKCADFCAKVERDCIVG